MNKTIYLDYQASTPVDARVLKVMVSTYKNDYANPHAIHHQLGQASAKMAEDARTKVAACIGAHPSEIIFTSGATEANNFALRGIMAQALQQGKNNIITSSIEHSSILKVCEYLEKQGAKVTYLPVSKEGVINPADVAAAITSKTALVTIMGANNEIGSIQPLEEIGNICKEKGVLFHADVAQCIGRSPLNVQNIAVDMLSFSSHKIYGPQGIGALYMRRSSRLQLEPLIHGGGQEKGYRSGTLPVALAVGFGEACALMQQEGVAESEQITQLRNKFLSMLQQQLPQLEVNGTGEEGLPQNLSITFPNVEMADLAESLKNKVAVSFGSACSSGRYKGSHVLKAIGRKSDGGTTVRFSFGRQTTEAEIQKAAAIIITEVNKLTPIK